MKCTPLPGYVTQRRTGLPLISASACMIIWLLLAMYSQRVGRPNGQGQAVGDQANRPVAGSQPRAWRWRVAERRRTELVLRDSEALYSSLVETLPVQVLRKDLDGCVLPLPINPSAALLRKPNRRNCRQGRLRFLSGTELAQKYREDDRQVAQTGKLFEDEEENESRRRDAGSTRDEVGGLQRPREDRGNAVHLLGHHRTQARGGTVGVGQGGRGNGQPSPRALSWPT